MKKYLLSALSLCILSTITFAQQLPNAGFETWSGSGNNEKPDNWNQLNASLPSSVAIFVPQTCFKTTNPHSGTYCTKLETVNVSFQGPVNGILTTGDIITSPPYGVENGLPYPYRPDSLVGWYKVQPASGDLGTVEITLLDANADTVGRGKFFSPSSNVTTWTRFSVAIDYYNGTTPDKAITLASSSDGFNPVVGSQLWIDDLELIFNPLFIDEGSEEPIAVYANGNFIYVNLLENKTNDAQLNLYSIDGKLLMTKNLQNNSVNATETGLSTGIYIYTIEYGEKIISGKISIR